MSLVVINPGFLAGFLFFFLDCVMIFALISCFYGMLAFRVEEQDTIFLRPDRFGARGIRSPFWLRIFLSLSLLGAKFCCLLGGCWWFVCQMELSALSFVCGAVAALFFFNLVLVVGSGK